MPTLVKLRWASGGNIHVYPVTMGAAEGNLTFAQRASTEGKTALQADPPSGCVQMKWCSSGTPHDPQVCPNQGESAEDFIARSAQWIYDQLIEFPASNDCVPPWP